MSSQTAGLGLAVAKFPQEGSMYGVLLDSLGFYAWGFRLVHYSCSILDYLLSRIYAIFRSRKRHHGLLLVGCSGVECWLVYVFALSRRLVPQDLGLGLTYRHRLWNQLYRQNFLLNFYCLVLTDEWHGALSWDIFLLQVTFRIFLIVLTILFKYFIASTFQKECETYIS